MPLYIEILDRDSSVAELDIRGIEKTGVLESWTSATTNETVRLVDVPDEYGSPRTTVRSARILFY
jgi:hypothetical protein